MKKSKSLSTGQSKELTKYDPIRGVLSIHAAREQEKRARRARDRDELARAIEKKLSNQGDFVVWWDTEAERRQQRDNQHIAKTQEAAFVKPEDYGLTVPLLSRWRIRLKDPDIRRATIADETDRAVRRLEFGIGEPELQQLAQDDERIRIAAELAAWALTADPGECGVFHEPFQTCADRLDPESVRLIFTDPPYHDEHIPMYWDLGQVAKRVLKDGGSLITYTSHHKMPEVIRLVEDAGLTFFWPIAMIHAGGPWARMTEYGIVVKWKPLLWFVKGAFRDRTFIDFVEDAIDSPREKGLHPWQQSTAEASYYIDKLTEPGDLVFDPFCGSGTTAAAAASLERRWLTCDTDETAVLTARRRLTYQVA